MLVFAFANLVAPGVTFIIITVVPYWVDWDTTVGILLPGILLLIHVIKARVNHIKLRS